MKGENGAEHVVLESIPTQSLHVETDLLFFQQVLSGTHRLSAGIVSSTFSHEPRYIAGLVWTCWEPLSGIMLPRMRSPVRSRSDLTWMEEGAGVVNSFVFRTIMSNPPTSLIIMRLLIP